MEKLEGFQIPSGLDSWLIDFVRSTLGETEILRRNGAETQAVARDVVVQDFLRRARGWADAEISIGEAAATLGKCEETVRRAVRGGELSDLRTTPRGHIRVRRGEVVAHRNKAYDPVADAQDIAKLRRLK